VEVAYFDGTAHHKGLATTLGAGGLFIRTDEPLDAGTRISLRFCLPSSNAPHALEGRVVWANRPRDARPCACGMGIAFADPDHVARLARELDDDADGAERKASR
jgi:type IV pilus assembly protein PilZ